METIDLASDTSSVLSDRPSAWSDADDKSQGNSQIGNFDSPPTSVEHDQDSAKHILARRKRLWNSTSTEGVDSPTQVSVARTPICKRRKKVRHASLSPIEAVPYEIGQKIVACLGTDTDLRNVLLSSPTIAKSIDPEKSEVWRVRFLQFYDYPFVDHVYQFSWAYKLRRMILREFTEFSCDIEAKTFIQLEVLRDLVIEAYRHRQPRWSMTLLTSRNLNLMASPTHAPWMVKLLSCPFPGHGKSAYGKPNSLFESLQLALSYLCLSPTSAFSHLVCTSREDYDVVRVYQFNLPLETLFTRREVKATTEYVTRTSQLTLPRLPRAVAILPSPRIEYKLDTHTLLHIQHFWQRHLVNDGINGERTFADMQRGLMRLGKLPTRWEQSLYDDVPIAESWHGIYSAVRPWPGTRSKLAESQSCADGWDVVDPLVLKFATSKELAQGFWPASFGTIPLFHHTVPSTRVSESQWQTINETEQDIRKHGIRDFPPQSTQGGVVYMRGIATFLDLVSATNNNKTSAQHDPRQSRPSTPNKTERYHPFTALRIRGVIHEIPPSATTNKDDIPPGLTERRHDLSIPGWKRIVMILYKPTVRYLLRVLDQAADELGAQFPPSSGPTLPMNAPSATQATTTSPSGQAVDVDVDVDARLWTLLHERLRIYSTHHASLNTPHDTCRAACDMWSVSHLIAMENSYASPNALSWDDGTIEYAYAYEGTIMPGGKVMMGRYWRIHGTLGTGDGREVGTDGLGIVTESEDMGMDDTADDHDHSDSEDVVGEQPNETEDQATGRRGTGGREFERGPFIFWS